MKIHLASDEHVAFVGMTGSGKTELAKHLLRRLNRVVVLDTKNTFQLEGFEKRRNLPLFGRRFRIIYRPPLFPNEEDDYKLARFLMDMVKVKHVTVYCDELSSLRDYFPQSTRALANLARVGRELHVSVWIALQRPRWVPLWFFTEANAMFIFNLKGVKDRLYMAEQTGEEVGSEIEEHAFWWTHVRDKIPTLMKLDLNKNYILKIG